MIPVKFNKEHAPPMSLIDLRDYGMGNSAPKIDGNPIMRFWLTGAGILYPAFG